MYAYIHVLFHQKEMAFIEETRKTLGALISEWFYQFENIFPFQVHQWWIFATPFLWGHMLSNKLYLVSCKQCSVSFGGKSQMLSIHSYFHFLSFLLLVSYSNPLFLLKSISYLCRIKIVCNYQFGCYAWEGIIR